MTLGKVPQLLLLVGGGVGDLLGWRIFRARVRHSLYDEVPAGRSRQEYARRLRGVARLKALLRVILCAAAGALIAWSLSSMVR